MKNLTLSKGKIMICLVLTCLFLTQSCRKGTLLPSKGPNDLTIAEARNYFEKNIRQTVNPKKLMSTGGANNSSTDPTLQEILNNKQAIWEDAYQKMISTGFAVKVPLNFGKTYVVTDVAKKELVPFGSLNYLFMYKDSLERIHTEWVVMVPDKDWLYGNRDVYSGKIVVKDWDGHFIKEYNYKGLSSNNNISSIKNKLKATLPTSMSGSEEPPITPTEPTGPGLGILCITVCHEFCGVNVIDSRKCWFVGNGEDEGGSGDDGTGSDGTGSNGSGNGSHTGGSGSSSSGGGTGPGDYPPPTTCNPDPNATQAINGIVPCSWMVPPPTPVGLSPVLDREETDFLNNPDVKIALDDYFREASDKTAADEFYHWAIGYLIENPEVTVAELIDTNNISNTNINLPNLDATELTNYPKFKALVNDLPNFLTRYPNILKALSLTTGLTEKKIKELMQPGKGPKVIVVNNLKDADGNDVVGQFDDKNKILKIDNGYINDLDLANTPTKYQAIGLILTITTLHEFVHFGRDANNLPKRMAGVVTGKGSFEAGWYFEDIIVAPGSSRLEPANAHEWLRYYRVKSRQ